MIDYSATHQHRLWPPTQGFPEKGFFAAFDSDFYSERVLPYVTHSHVTLIALQIYISIKRKPAGRKWINMYPPMYYLLYYS